MDARHDNGLTPMLVSPRCVSHHQWAKCKDDRNHGAARSIRVDTFSIAESATNVLPFFR